MVEIESSKLTGKQGVKRVCWEAAGESAVVPPPENAGVRSGQDQPPDRLFLQNPLQERKELGSILELIDDDALDAGGIRNQSAEPLRMSQKLAAE